MEVLGKRWCQELKVWKKDVRVLEKWAYGRAGRHKDRPQQSKKSGSISFLANEASCCIPGSTLGSLGRSPAMVLPGPSPPVLLYRSDGLEAPPAGT